ncbi:hypothetical protein LSAT2_026446, partial [Lamellibrachia satsuma]
LLHCRIPASLHTLQLTAFIITRLEDYYVQKLVDVTYNRLSGHNIVSRFYPSPRNVPLDTLERVADGHCKVGSGSGHETCDVDVHVGLCTRRPVYTSACVHVGLFTCQVGRSGAAHVDNDMCDSGVQREDARDSDACAGKVSCDIGDTSDGVTEL